MGGSRGPSPGAVVAALRRQLRSVGAPAAVVAGRSGPALSPAVGCDLSDVRDVLRRRDEDAVMQLLDSRPDLLTGSLLESSRGVPWADRARADFASDLLELHLVAGRVALRLGRPASASWHAARAAVLEPRSEAAVRMRMTALARMGENALAVGAFLELRDRLRDELAIEPSPPTVRTYLALLRQLAATRDLGRGERGLVLRLHAAVARDAGATGSGR